MKLVKAMAPPHTFSHLRGRVLQVTKEGLGGWLYCVDDRGYTYCLHRNEVMEIEDLIDNSTPCPNCGEPIIIDYDGEDGARWIHQVWKRCPCVDVTVDGVTFR